MRYPSDKNPFVTLLLFGALVLMAVLCYQMVSNGGTEQWNILILAGVSAFMLWMWFGTYYDIDGRELRYRSGPVNGSIDIGAIRKIEVGKTKFVGLKPALGAKGCVIHYNIYDEIYLSPKDKPSFIAALKAINPAIVVEERS